MLVTELILSTEKTRATHPCVPGRFILHWTRVNSTAPGIPCCVLPTPGMPGPAHVAKPCGRFPGVRSHPPPLLCYLLPQVPLHPFQYPQPQPKAHCLTKSPSFGISSALEHPSIWRSLRPGLNIQSCSGEGVCSCEAGLLGDPWPAEEKQKNEGRGLRWGRGARGPLHRPGSTRRECFLF